MAKTKINFTHKKLIVAGCDLHSSFAKVAYVDGKGNLIYEKQYPTTIRGIALLVADLAAIKCKRIAVESVGHFWVHFVYTLQSLYSHIAGLTPRIIVANPYSTRSFGKKTDSLDALRIARLFLAGNLIASNIPRSLEEYLFKALCRLRVKLAHERGKAVNRLRKLLALLGYKPSRLTKKILNVLEELALGKPPLEAFKSANLKAPEELGVKPLPVEARGMLEAMLKVYNCLSVEVKALDSLIERQAEKFYGELYSYVRTVPGVGPLLAAIILAETVDARRFSSASHYKSYCGLAPRLRESSGRARLGRCRRSNLLLRWAFYMAAVRAIRNDGELRCFYERLVARGKPRRVALVAVAGKLARRTWAVMVRREPYRPRC